MDDATSGRELKFRALAKDLRQEISEGRWEPGAKLPTEKELMAQRELSLTTVRRALDELADDGLIVRRQGSGSYVSTDLRRGAGAMRTIGVLVPSATEYYPRVLAGVESALSGASARMVLASYHYDAVEEERDMASLLASGIDGLIAVPDLLSAPNTQEKIESLFDLPVPVVMLERRDFEARISDRSEYVCTDHAGGAYDAVRHLRTLGHEQIGLVCRHPNHTGNWVVQGYKDAVQDLALPALPIDTAPASEWSLERAEAALHLLRKSRTTAALVFGDREAAWIEAAARRAGVRIPEDLALVAYDDESAAYADIPLTAVSPPKHELGRLAAETLLQRVHGNDENVVHQITLRPPLVIRDSCGASDLTRAIKEEV
ncbi:substrate-binding domain-containing protein [Pseudactinotalea sp. Z1739]|uniref:GntR family transcriptional regulator n=1 Tax=Pseudactinotalea sp. Z1739 TaxID=3413028 RepID=UPI003C7CC9D4